MFAIQRFFLIFSLFFSLIFFLHVLFLTLNGTPAGLKRRGGSRGPGSVNGRRPEREN